MWPAAAIFDLGPYRISSEPISRILKSKPVFKKVFFECSSYAPMGGPRKFRQGVQIVYFLSSTYFKEGRTDHPREAIGPNPNGSNCFLLLEGGPYQNF